MIDGRGVQCLSVIPRDVTAAQTMNRYEGRWYMCENHSGVWYHVNSKATYPPSTGWQVSLMYFHGTADTASCV